MSKSKRDIEGHAYSICALITKTGTHQGPARMLHEAIKDAPLNWDDYCDVLEYLVNEGYATLKVGILALTKKGISKGKNFRAGMELHKSTKKQGPIEEGLN